MKKKHLNTLKIASLTLMLGCFAVGGVYNHYQEKQQDNVVKVERKIQPKYASYNDETYTITLTADEVNNYTWSNLADVLYDNKSSVSSFTAYYGEQLLDNCAIDYDDDDYYGASFKNTNYHFLYLVVNNENFDETLNYTGSIPYKFYYRENGTWIDSFVYDIQLICVSTVYTDVKSAIELDIQANQPVSMGDSIIESIGSGLGIIPNIAGEFLAGFSKLLWDNNQLTNFAIYSLVFLGIAITFAVIKLVLAIIRGNTGA